MLVADRWAARPLYFATGHGRMAFASEIRALLAWPDVPATPNLGALDVLQATKYLPTGEGLLAEVRPVVPGGWACLRADGWEAGTYAPVRLEVDPDRAEEACADELRDVMLAAARRLVVTHGTVGIALSAGLDSTLTLGAVRAVAPHVPIHTFTASFHADDPDLALAAEAARHFGAIHHQIVIPPEDLPRLLPETVWAMEDPICREEMVLYFVLVREAARHAPNLLYGQMSDVLFGGMPRHLVVKAAAEFPWLRRPLADFYDYTQTGRRPSSWLGRLLVRMYYRGRATPPARVLDAPRDGGASKGLVLAPDQPLNALLLDSSRTPTETAAMERLHAMVGTTYGSIFHDREVVASAFRIPDRLKIRGGVRKYILRRAAVGILPDHLAARPKGLVRIVRDQARLAVIDRMAEELLAPEAVRARDWFDPDDIARLRRRTAHGSYADDQFYHLWTLLLTEIWARTFIDGRGAGPIRLDNGPPRPSATVPIEHAGVRPGSRSAEGARGRAA